MVDISTHLAGIIRGPSDIMPRMPAASRIRKSKSKEQETLHFKIKRSHFYAVVVPLAFLLGLTAGYVAWGRSVSAPSSAPGPIPTDASGQSSGSGDIASQIASLPRYDVTISEDDPVLGPADAPITLIEFADFQCPFCQRYAQETFPRLREDYGDQIRFVYKDFPLSSIHADAFSAALSAQCAQEQDKFWEYHDLLFGGTLGLGREAYDSYAQQLGLDVAAFDQCLDEERYTDIVQADYAIGNQLGIQATPTFFINGIALVGAQPYELFAQIIDYELSQQQ